MERISLTLSESERLRIQLYQSLKPPGHNPPKGAALRRLVEAPSAVDA